VASAALDLLGSLVLEDGRRWGDAAADFQRWDAEWILDTEPPPYHFLTRARGASKTSDLGGMSVAVMLSQLSHAKLFAFAADKDQAALLVEAISGFAERTPELKAALDIQEFKVIAPRTGCVLRVMAADDASAWGLKPAWTVIDELPMWPETRRARRLFDAITTAHGKVPGSRMVCLGTAGDPAHWSYKVRQHAAEDPLWDVNEEPGPPPWMDPVRLAEQKRRLTDALYQRLFLNRWTSAEDRLVSDDDLAACVTLEGPLPPEPGLGYVVACDYGAKKDRTVTVVCHGEPLTKEYDSLGTEVATATRVVLDRMEVWQGSRERTVPLSEVEDWIEQASKTFNYAPVRLDPWQMLGSAQRLSARGLKVEEFNFGAQSVGRLASALHRLLRDRLLALPDDVELLDELRTVRLEERTPGVVRMSHDSSRHDDRAVALALAAHWIVEQDTGPPGHAEFIESTPWDAAPGSLLYELTGFERMGGSGLTPGMRL